MNKQLLMTAVGACALLAGSPALAQTVTLNSQLIVQNGCVINGTSSGATALLDFGTVQNASALTVPIDAQTAAGAINIVCNAAASFSTVSISAGANGSATQRTLRNALAGGTPGEFVNYSLYNSPGRNSVPGSEYLPGLFVGSSGGIVTPNVPFELTIYGRIATGDAASTTPGTYTDVTTLTFVL